jgi:hypothetical protein
MKEQLLYFYRRSKRKFYKIKIKGQKESLFSGDNENDLEMDFDNLSPDEYIIYVANNEQGFAQCPEFPFTVSRNSGSGSSNVRVNQNVSFEDAVKKAYEAGKADLLKQQKQEAKEQVLEWLIENKQHFETLIKDLTDADTSNDEPAKHTFMDAVSEIPDAIGMLQNLSTLGKA